MKKIIARISQFFKDVKKRHRNKMLQERVKQLSNVFTIDERNDRIYIICGNTPVYEAELRETTESVLEKMQQMRQAAYSYNNVLRLRTKSPNN